LEIPIPKKKVCNFVGGEASPLLANVALDGMERLFNAEWPDGRPKAPAHRKGLNKGVAVIRYADDVRHITRCQIPFTERRGSEEKTFGSTTHLEAKAEGDNSMSLKRRVSEGVYATAPQDPCAMVRATLPKPQLPAMEAYIPCPQRLLAGSPRYVGKVVAGGTFRVVSDAE
jgi:hypothetical protein